MFIDVHCHLDLSKNVEEVISEMRKKKVICISNGINIKTNREVLKLAEEFPEIKVALGIYPIETLKITEKELDEEIKFIEKNKEKIVSVGEVGLDAAKPSILNAPKGASGFVTAVEIHESLRALKESNELVKQVKALEKFIKLSNKIDKALSIHSRKAELQCIEVLEKNKAKKVLMHHFSGKLKLVDRIVKNGWFLSIPSSVNYSGQFQQVVKQVPIQNLLCETDSPYLHPERKGENNPSNVIFSYKKIAEIKQLSLKEVEEQIEKNYKKLFS